MHPGPQHVLILAYHFPPDSQSGAARAYRFYKYLREFGYRTHVIARGEGSSDLEDVYYVPNPILVPKQLAPLALTERALRKFFFPVDEAMTWAFAAKRAAEHLLSTVPLSAVLSTFPPVNSHVAAFCLKRRYGLTWIADFRDPVAGNPFRPGGFPAKIDVLLERFLFRHADRVIAVTDPIAASWRQLYPQWADKIEVIWNGIDPEEEFPDARHAPRASKVLTHVGSLYGARSPVSVLRSMARLIDGGALDPAKAHVRLLGYMDDDIYTHNRTLFDTLHEKGCLEWAGEVSRAEAKATTADADYLLLLDQNSRDVGYTVPAKLFDYVRAGRPILAITPRNSPVDVLLPQSGVPHLILYTGDSDEQIDAQLLRLFQLPSQLVSPSASFLHRFDGRRQVETLASLLDAATRERGRSACSCR